MDLLDPLGVVLFAVDPVNHVQIRCQAVDVLRAVP